MSKNCLLLGTSALVQNAVRHKMKISNINMYCETSLDAIKKVATSKELDFVIIGTEMEIEERCDIVKYFSETQQDLLIHMKDWNSGPGGMIPFVENVLASISDEN